MPRKLVEFHPEDRSRLDELVEDRSTSFQELMDEAVRDLLIKHDKYTDLRTALKKSAQGVGPPKPPIKKRKKI